MSSLTLRNLGLLPFEAANCKSAKAQRFGLDCMSAKAGRLGLGVLIEQMYIASKLSSGESSLGTIAFITSTVFTLAVCDLVRHLLVKCPIRWHFLHWYFDAGQLNPCLCLVSPHCMQMFDVDD